MKAELPKYNGHNNEITDLARERTEILLKQVRDKIGEKTPVLSEAVQTPNKLGDTLMASESVGQSIQTLINPAPEVVSQAPIQSTANDIPVSPAIPGASPAPLDVKQVDANLENTLG